MKRKRKYLFKNYFLKRFVIDNPIIEVSKVVCARTLNFHFIKVPTKVLDKMGIKKFPNSSTPNLRVILVRKND